MNEVTILNTYTQLANGQTILGFLISLLFLFIITIILVCAYFFKYFEEKKKNYACLIVSIILFVLFIAGVYNFPSKKYQTYYQVVVSDSASFNEFQNKYEIVKVNGKIYTVKEIEDE